MKFSAPVNGLFTGVFHVLNPLKRRSFFNAIYKQYTGNTQIIPLEFLFLAVLLIIRKAVCAYIHS